MSLLPNSAGTPATMVDGFTGLGHKATINADPGGNVTLLSTISDIQHYTLTASRTFTLPSTDAVTGTTLKQGRALVFHNHGAFDMVFQASGGQALTTANSCNQDATIQKGYVVLRALQDAPTLAAHWWVEQVYEEYTHSTTFTPHAGGSASSAVTIKLVRSNKTVTIDFPGTSNAVPNTGTSPRLDCNTVLPTRWRPVAVQKQGQSTSYNGGVWEPGHIGFLLIAPDGNLYVYRDTANGSFTNGLAAGVDNVSFAYTLT